MKEKLKAFIRLHKFFVTESRSFVGVRVNGKFRIKRFRDKLYYPIAYIKFMYYSFKN